MTKNVLPKSVRIHIRRQKSVIRKQTSSPKDKKEGIENLYKKFIIAHKSN